MKNLILIQERQTQIRLPFEKTSALKASMSNKNRHTGDIVECWLLEYNVISLQIIKSVLKNPELTDSLIISLNNICKFNTHKKGEQIVATYQRESTKVHINLTPGGSP